MDDLELDDDLKGVKWTVGTMEAELEVDDVLVGQAIVTLLYERQGFDMVDAIFGTSLAKSALKYGHLTPKQMPYARKLVIRYAGRLAEVANDKLLADMEKVLA